MNRNEFNFNSEKLFVDWIGFNIQELVDRKEIEIIAKYLFQNFGFNFTIAKKINGKWKSQVSFRQHQYDPESKSFWVETHINFSGKNAPLL